MIKNSLFFCENNFEVWIDKKFVDFNTCQFITNQEQFKEIDLFNLTEVYDQILILLNLSWYDDPNNFSGLKLLEEIRMKSCLLPIIVFSTLNEQEIRSIAKSEDLRFHVFKTPAHHYVQINEDFYKSIQITNSKSLTNHLLQDIRYHFFNTIGSVDRIFHKLKGYTSNYQLINEIDLAFEQLNLLVPKAKQGKLDILKNELLDKLLHTEEGKQASVINDLKPKILEHVPDNNESKKFNNAKWSVLCIDDNAKHLELIQDMLLASGIHCFQANSGEEAFRILEKDRKKQLFTKDGSSGKPIKVILSDLRFEYPGGDWHFWQGWDIIQQIHDQYTNQYAFFILSSKRSSLQLHTGEEHDMLIYAYNKDNVLNEEGGPDQEWLLTHIHQEGNRIYQRQDNLPAPETWQNLYGYPFARYYEYHCASIHYKTLEKEINNYAKQYIEQVLIVRKQNDSIHIESDEDLKNVKKVGLALTRCKSNMNGKHPGDPEIQDRFQNKLKARRIAIGLHFLELSFNRNEISHYLMKGFEDPRKTYNRDVYHAIGLGADIDHEFAQNKILLEERAFLEQEMHIAIDAHQRSFFGSIKKLLERFLLEESLEMELVHADLRMANSIQLSQSLQKAYSLLAKKSPIITKNVLKELRSILNRTDDWSKPQKTLDQWLKFRNH